MKDETGFEMTDAPAARLTVVDEKLVHNYRRCACGGAIVDDTDKECLYCQICEPGVTMTEREP